MTNIHELIRYQKSHDRYYLFGAKCPNIVIIFLNKINIYLFPHHLNQYRSYCRHFFPSVPIANMENVR